MLICNFFCVGVVIQHGKPLEDVLFFPSGGLLASAGGTEVKIWDIVGGGRQVQTLGSHQKTVTSLTVTAPRESDSALEKDGRRLLTSSLDGHVRVFDLSQFKVFSPSLSSSCDYLCEYLYRLKSNEHIPASLGVTGDSGGKNFGFYFMVTGVYVRPECPALEHV